MTNDQGPTLSPVHRSEPPTDDELLKRHDLAATVLDTVAALVIVVDRNGTVVSANRACERTTGYRADEIKGHLVWEFLAPEEVPLVRAGFEQLRAGLLRNDLVSHCIIKGGERRLISWLNTGLCDADGNVAYVVASGIDITDRQQAENALRDANEELEQRVAERTAELWEANEMLHQQIDDRAEIDQALQRRDRILEAVGFAAEQFLRSVAWDETVDMVLQRLGKAADVSRVYVFQFRPEPARGESVRQLYEWVAPGVAPFTSIPELENVDWEELGFGSWGETLRNGGWIDALVSDLPPRMQWSMRLQGTLSMVVVPIFSGGNWWGFLGFDDCKTEREWSAIEVQSLKTAASTLGAALERQEMERALRESSLTLERRVDERTRELATLLEVSRRIVSTLDLPSLLDLILDQLGAVIEYSGATIFCLDDDHLSVLAYRGPIAAEEVLPLRFPLERARANLEVIRRRRPVIIDDVRGDAPLARAFQEFAGDELVTTFGYIRSWMGVPLIIGHRVIGMMSLDYSTPGHYSERSAEISMAFAAQVAVAIENARLYLAEHERHSEAERRRDVAEGLRDILGILNSNRPLDAILHHIVSQAARLLHADAVALYRLHDNEGMLRIQAAVGLSSEYVKTMAVPIGFGAVGRAAVTRSPIVIEDMASSLSPELTADSVRRELLDWILARFRGMIAVPLVIKDEVYGGITLYYPGAREFASEEIQLIVSLADQAALAIENARLREQAQEIAVAAERSRLARDLHDAVTQTLFSASLIAEVLPRLWDRNPEEGRRRLEELRQLSRGALAEMRTLLLELRPSTLTEVSLPDLLKQLGEAITGRARIPVQVDVDSSRPFAPDVQIALYRIAQEALNNVAKHSAAQHACVTLICRPQRAELTIADDGRGFEIDRVPPDHLGLAIMRERAEAVGAQLDVSSQSGGGTRVRVAWSEKGEDSQ